MTARARNRDRLVYLASHPVLFGLLGATRRRAALRIGGVVLVHGRAEFTRALTRIPLDRTAAGTTGGAAGELVGSGNLFDQSGDDHRSGRRDAATLLGAGGVALLRPRWMAVLARHLAVLGRGGELDVVPLAVEMAGVTAAALVGADGADPVELAEAGREAGATAARLHLPGLPRPGARAAAERAAERLAALAGPDGRSAMLVVAAVNTTVAVLPRAVAWAADANLWSPHTGTAPGTARSAARQDPAMINTDISGQERAAYFAALADELLRVTAATPLLPRVAAAGGELGGCPVRAGDRLMLVARHAAAAHTRDPDPIHPAPAKVGQLVFGTGPHACPGARLARAQLYDVLKELSSHRPVVTRARPDRRAALPGWRTLRVRASG